MTDIVLIDRVQTSLMIFGRGFLSHPVNTDLRADIDLCRYHRQLLRLTIRVVILMVMHDRGMKISSAVYSLDRLRSMVVSGEVPNISLLLVLAQHFAVFDAMEDGDILGSDAITDIYRYSIAQGDIIAALRLLMDVDYADIPLEILGGVNEVLMGTRMILSDGQLEMSGGNERKITGSYYTPPELIEQLLITTLDPVMEQKLIGKATTKDKVDALLSMSVCDPSCGSGHFLVAAARRITARIQQIVREDNTFTGDMSRAMRCVIAHCIYGVDLNPAAVDLCRVVLWIESYVDGEPILDLSGNIKWGNALVGTINDEMVANGIPDDAFDDPNVRQRNRREREQIANQSQQCLL